jgi:hypothetical protein
VEPRRDIYSGYFRDPTGHLWKLIGNPNGSTRPRLAALANLPLDCPPMREAFAAALEQRPEIRFDRKRVHIGAGHFVSEDEMSASKGGHEIV